MSGSAALVAAVVLSAMTFLVSPTASGVTTYSESALGALVSPWNPSVVLFPFLLFVVLCASAVGRSICSLVGAVLVATFVVQTDISTLPVAAAILAATVVAVALQLIRRRSTDRRGGGQPDAILSRREAMWSVTGLAVLVVAWIPPLLEELTGHPGNLTLIARFFSAGNPGHSVLEAARSVGGLITVGLYGPAEIYGEANGGVPRHVVAVVLVSLVFAAALAAALILAVRRKGPFESALVAASGLGLLVLMISVTRIVGPIVGYLLLWALGLVVAGVLGAALVASSIIADRLSEQGRRISIGLSGLVACVLCAGTLIHVAAMPSLATVNSPQVGSLAALASRNLPPGATVLVVDEGAGSASTWLLDAERVFGLINWLDLNGYHPKVLSSWAHLPGAGFASDGREPYEIRIKTWDSAAPTQSGYIGKVGDMAVFLIPKPS